MMDLSSPLVAHCNREVSDFIQSALDGFKVCLFSYGQVRRCDNVKLSHLTLVNVQPTLDSVVRTTGMGKKIE